MPRGIPRSPPPGVECHPPTTQPQNRQWIRNRAEHRRIRHVAPRNCVEAGGGRAGQDGGCASSKSRGDQSRIMPSFDEELLEEIAGRQAEAKAPSDLPPPSPWQQGQGHEISGRRHHRSFARRDLLHKIASKKVAAPRTVVAKPDLHFDSSAPRPGPIRLPTLSPNRTNVDTSADVS